MQRVVVIPYRSFGTSYRPHLQGSRLGSCTLKMCPVGCPETTITNYHYLLRNGPQERSSHILRDGILKSVNVRFSLFAERTDSCLMYLGMVEGLLLLVELWKKRVLLTCGAPLNLNVAVQAVRHKFKVSTGEKKYWHCLPCYMATSFSRLHIVRFLVWAVRCLLPTTVHQFPSTFCEHTS